MFEISKTNALVKSINPRAENHGDEPVLACDIGLEFAVSNQTLNQLDPALLPCLYSGGEAAVGQEHLSLEEGFLPHLRFPSMGKLPWKYEGVGYKVQLIDDRLGGDHVIELCDCKLNKFEIECEEGGTIKLSVRVQGNPSEETIGELCHYIKSEVDVSLMPPQAAESAQQEWPDEEPF